MNTDSADRTLYVYTAHIAQCTYCRHTMYYLTIAHSAYIALSMYYLAPALVPSISCLDR